MQLRPGEMAWVDQQNAQLRDALNVVLNGIDQLDQTAPASDQRHDAEAVGIALSQHLDTLTPLEIELLALTAVIRLAERIHTTKEQQ